MTRDPAGAKRRLRPWPHGFLAGMALLWGTLAVWSPDGEPWWWRLLFVSCVAEVAWIIGREQNRG